MHIIPKQTILENFDAQEVLSAIEKAFIQFADGLAQVAPVTHLAFPEAKGECHVKSAHIQEEPMFVVKLATGFYDNAKHGLSSSNGFMAAISAATGEPLAILQDEGVLTDLRTALAGVIATRLGARVNSSCLGVIGSGIQARLQARMICDLLGYKKVIIWARSPDKVEKCISDLRNHLPNAELIAAHSPEDVCEQADAIVTTTAATEPVIAANWVRPGTHITAVGADSPGKQELDSAIFGKASIVIADSVPQCVEHGEISNAIASGEITADQIRALGQVLSKGHLERKDTDITIADLTGVAIQDVAIASCIVDKFLRDCEVSNRA
jgi:ornithine cyclodeaminase